MNRLVTSFLLSALFIFCNQRLCAGWQRSITNYSRYSYKAASQNWRIMQCSNGWMYFANNKGLLEFDGTNWAVYPIHNAKVRAVKAGKDGRIYVGGLQQFGYFVPNSLGRLDYICLSDSIDKRIIGNIWNIHITEDKVYFQSDNAVFSFKNGRIHRINCPSIVHSALVGERLYVAGAGVFVLSGNEFTLLPNTNSMVDNAGRRVIGIFSYRDKLLVVSNQGGLFFYENGTLIPFRSGADEFLKRNRLFCATMKGSLLALGTVQDGLLLLDMDTRETEHISTHNGLQNKTILSLFFDREDNLWLGLDNGIDCVHLHSPIFQNKATIGSGYASCLYRNKLYLGTNQGVFVTGYPLMLNEEQDLEPVWGTAGQIYSLAVYDDKLFCAGSNALGVLDGSELYFVSGIRGVWWVKPLQQKDKLLVATYIGLYLLKKSEGRWILDRKVEGRRFSSKSLYIEPSANALWTANKEGGLYRLSLSAGCDSIIKEKCYNSGELPIGDNVCIGMVDGETVIASRQGLFRYNPSEDCLDRYERLEKKMDGRVAYTYIMQDSLQNIWYVADGALKLLHYDPLTRSYYRSENEAYLKDCLIEDFEYVGVLANNEAVIGMEDGFSLLHFMQERVKKYPLNLQIRHVYLTGVNDSLVYGCSYVPNDMYLKIPYKNNSIRIEYSINNYDSSLALFYSCRLEGPVSEPWSQLGESAMKEYTRLPEGKYTFYVRTRIGLEKPIVASFSFEILPPWYRTWWSYLLYAALIVLLLAYIYYRIAAGRKRLVMLKELELYRQKQAFQKESELKSKKIDLLKEENLQAELHHKSEELIHTTLNLVRKNEMLQNIKSEVLSILHAAKEENLVIIRRKILCLITQIDTNMEHDDDLLAFQSTFDSVHHNLFQKLEARFPELTKREKLLCAYIKMNLMSKEIAPLLNISQRGVEVSRYRLRKKLGLGEGENLAEFLQKLSQ
ncbi:LuxR C-terminal-related transcriptional regulator [uncultured Bacteroides sp.]|uniref:ligand-binding sensor domain-containing protein n=1 Tax=uncultured Bacteroides sp. TaxID=162156 RepID=UPI00280C0E0A|nr:LuxR C-terminal-related transcriptional regulator [uncultured Bacteroides sp.]